MKSFFYFILERRLAAPRSSLVCFGVAGVGFFLRPDKPGRLVDPASRVAPDWQAGPKIHVDVQGRQARPSLFDKEVLDDFGLGVLGQE